MDQLDDRVLVLARGRDGPLTRKILAASGFAVDLPANLDDICVDIEAGAGAIVVAEELLTRPVVARLVDCLGRQPAWSDLPVLVIALADARVGRVLGPLDVLGNVSVLRRPASIDSFVTAVRSALRARRRQYEVRDLIRDREEADRRKSEFLAMLAHELRNPLAPIRSAAHILRFPDPDEATLRDVCNTLERQVSHMAHLIEGLLDASRIAGGRVFLERRRVDLTEALAQAAHTVTPLVESKRQTLTIAPPSGGLAVDADPIRLEQILSNLLNNSWRYTPAGGSIRLSAAPEGDVAAITIADDGVGIAPDLLPHIFDLFTQADRPLDRSQGGLGIGLTVVKRLVELHDGTIEARSDGTGSGLTMIVRLPVAQEIPPIALVDVDAPPTAPNPATGPQRVLIVEDHLDGAAMLDRLLRRYGHQVRVAHDGPSGLRAALEFSPDVILMDIGLPGMDGYTVARDLRSRPGFDAVSLVALTGYGDKNDAARAEAAGFDRHLTKPVEIDTLRSILDARPGRRG